DFEAYDHIELRIWSERQGDFHLALGDKAWWLVAGWNTVTIEASEIVRQMDANNLTYSNGYLYMQTAFADTYYLNGVIGVYPAE
ncbi:MAG: hypothetical protein K2H43_05770, partial [Clostridia bacterium]|nr:hypothetical protein [Clostridia bacterium]